MTGCAVLAQLAVVRLLGLVTGNALARCLAKFLPGEVATVAGDVHMRAMQRKVGSLVIEGLAAEFHDVGAAALMFDVTGAALGRVDAGQMAVEALSGAYVRGDFLVAIEAQLPLVAAITAVMTVRALFLVLLVSSRQFPWHEELFRVHGVAVAHRQQAQQNLHDENSRPQSGSH
jgi:hypothetical protein